MPWNDGLTGPALEFAAATEKRVRVLAGPGTGKTFALMRRVQRLVEEGCDPSRILVVTLTRTAAQDLAASLKSSGIQNAGQVVATTLHALCFSILQRHEVLDITGRTPRLLAGFETDMLLRDLPEDLGNFTAREKFLTRYEEAWAWLNGNPYTDPSQDLDTRFYHALIQRLKWTKAMLVGELVPLTRAFLAQNPACPELERFDHVLVDEYQDLNKADQQVIELLARSGLPGRQAHLSVIGDDDQSIYVLLRHAWPQGIIQFQRERDITLNYCRRCPKAVVALAQRLIEGNPGREKPPLQPDPTKPEGLIHNVAFSTMETEAEGLAKFICKRIQDGVAPGDILVLANWREPAYLIRDRVIAAGYDAHSYFQEEALDKREAQEAYTVLRLLADPEDRVSIRCWLGLQHNAYHVTGYRRVHKYAVDQGISDAEALERLSNGVVSLPHTGPIVDAWRALKARIEPLKSLTTNVRELVNTLLPDGNENLRGLRRCAETALASLESDPVIYLDFIEKVKREISLPEVPLKAQFVRLMSLHKSKGLTAKVVIIAGMVHGLIPRTPKESLTPTEKRHQEEEQRRVAYVGFTRVTEELVLSKYTRTTNQERYRSGAVVGAWSNGTYPVLASQYLSELGPQLPTAISGDTWSY